MSIIYLSPPRTSSIYGAEGEFILHITNPYSLYIFDDAWEHIIPVQSQCQFIIAYDSGQLCAMGIVPC